VTPCKSILGSSRHLADRQPPSYSEVALNMSHHVMPYQSMPCHVMWRDAMSCRDVLYDIVLVLSRDVSLKLYPIMLLHSIISCHATPCHTMPHHATPCHSTAQHIATHCRAWHGAAPDTYGALVHVEVSSDAVAWCRASESGPRD